MLRLYLAVWMLIPVGLLAWHFGPGQPELARDKAGDVLRKARAADDKRDWLSAAELYAKTAAALPDGDRAERNRLQVLQARARIRGGEILEGQEQLENLLAALASEPADSPALETDAFNELAYSSYYAAWIMRLEGATAEEWKPEAETARQLFRFLAERSQKAAAGDADTFQQNLENTIRLEQMDLATLQAKPKPKCCCNCRNLSQRKRKQSQSRCDNKSHAKGDTKQKKEDEQLRKDIRSAGIGEREGSGS